MLAGLWTPGEGLPCAGVINGCRVAAVRLILLGRGFVAAYRRGRGWRRSRFRLRGLFGLALDRRPRLRCMP